MTTLRFPVISTLFDDYVGELLPGFILKTERWHFGQFVGSSCLFGTPGLLLTISLEMCLGSFKWLYTPE